MALPITITNAGRAEMIAAQNTGTEKVTIVAVALGAAQYTPLKTQTALQAEIKRVTTIAGQAVADDTIHVVAMDESSAAYNVGEFGLISDKGTLIAVYSQLPAAGWIIQKAAPSTLLLATDIILESLDASVIEFGDISFINPPATESTPGVTTLVNNLTTDSSSAALTAAQGKKLQDEKEPVIGAGTTAQYWSGNKAWRNFAADVRAAVLTGLSTATNAAVLATDSVLVALGKLQAQIVALAANKLDATANAVSATKLQVARLIGGVAFDGTANINLPGVNTAGNQNTTGNAATATKLAVARLINGTAFDGSGNINVTDDSKLPLVGGNVSGYINMAQNVSGGYGSVSGSGGAWGATVWGMGHTYSGSAAGTAYAPNALYGLAWLRSGHSADTFAGEGVYLYLAGNQYAGMGAAGFWTSGSYTGKGTGLTDIPQAGVAGLVAALAAKAALSSPAFTGAPTTPTPAAASNTTHIPNTAWVRARLNELPDSPKNTSGIVGNSAWWKCGDTGFIRQFGLVTEAANVTDYRSFPIAFPNACMSLVATRTSGWDSANAEGTTSFIASRTQFAVLSGIPNGNLIYYEATGY